MEKFEFPKLLPKEGIGEEAAYALFEAAISERSTPLGDQKAFAHMDPPTPEIAAQIVGLNARFNQNLLHPDLSPFATEAERAVISWLAPLFGMEDGHMCAGSTLSNLTALWCAREVGATRVLASADAHISVAKSAHILAMPLVSLPVDAAGRMQVESHQVEPTDALVATAGTTGRGVIDPLDRLGALWLHVDAAWAGPLKLTRYADLLKGIEQADSVAISAHKWFYQPKDSALVLFKDQSHQTQISFGGSYLSTPNIGVQGSRGAAALPLLATLMAWGQNGLAIQIQKNMADAEMFAKWVEQHDALELKQMPETGVVNWRPISGSTDELALKGVSSITSIEGEVWMRQVAANPHVRLRAVTSAIEATL